MRPALLPAALWIYNDHRVKVPFPSSNPGYLKTESSTDSLLRHSAGSTVGRVLVRSLCFGFVCAFALRPTFAASVRRGEKTFEIPEGFELTEAAGAAMVLRPVSGSFDDEGSLYVTDSSGSNLPPAEQLKNPTHRIRRLRDTNQDGIFDKTEIFVDNVMFPQGCLWHAGSVYVAAPPSIWKFTDTDGDGKADQREEWFKGGTLTGCANDIHGPYRGPDGFIYWTKGAFAEQRHERTGLPPIHDSAAHILRARPDGSGLEIVMTGGMDNPVEVAFTSEGEPLFTSTFIDFSQPGWRDGIGHAVYGGVFGKENQVLEDGRVIRTTPDLLHPLVQFGAGAPSGICRVVTAGLGAEFQDNFFASTFNLHKITRHVLTPQGGSYTSRNSDWVTCDSMDFHPTDVFEDADGSLLIVDTGGWYKLCCPTSQLAKPDVLGTIYRLRRRGASGFVSDAARAAAYRKLAEPPPMNGDKAWVALKRRALEADPKSASELREALRTLLQKPDSEHALAKLRVAAEGLGRMKDPAATPLLLEAIDQLGHEDPVLAHSIVFALIEIGDASLLRNALAFPRENIQRAALVALSQLKPSGIQSKDVVGFLSSPDPGIRRTAAWVCSGHSDWGPNLAGHFQKQLSKSEWTPSEADGLASQLAQFAGTPGIADLLGMTASGKGESPSAAQSIALRAMSKAGLKEVPPTWHAALTQLIQGTNMILGTEAIDTAERLAAPKSGFAEFKQALLEAGMRSSLPVQSRLNALSAVPGGVDPFAPDVFEFVRSHLSATEPVESRSAAVSILAAAHLSREQLEALLQNVNQSGPLELPKLLAVYEKSSNEALGIALIETLKTSRSADHLRAEVLKPRLKNYPDVVKQRADGFLASLNTDLEQQKARLETILSEVQGKGDIRKGQAIFNSAKAACYSCHAVGYAGGKLGPDLTRIGEARSEKDLLEAILYPSASFVRSFEPMLVTTRSGEEHSGIVRKDTSDELVLGTGPNLDVRLARSEIADLRPGTVSVMPQGLETQISRQELADLIAFLKNTRWGAR
jgi:putative membrane-bound dehydrogenase-like protein